MSDPFEGQASAFLLSLCRTGALAQTAPVLGERSVPARVRAAVVVLVAAAGVALRPNATYDELFASAPAEVLFGLAVGMGSRFILLAAGTGGQIVGLDLGLGFAGTFDADARDESLPTQRILHALAGLAFLFAGGLEAAIRVAVSPLPPAMASLSLEVLVPIAAESAVAAVRIAAPVLFASFLVNVANGLLAKAAPALNMFSVVLAGVVAAGFAVLVATAPETISEVSRVGERAAAYLEGWAR